MEIEQNVSDVNNVNSNVTGKSNLTGPMVTKGKSNVTGPKVAQSKCDEKGPKATQGKINSNSNVTRQEVAYISNSNGQSDSPDSQNSQGQIRQHVSFSPSGKSVDSDSSSSELESPFKTPHTPKPRRTASHSLLRDRSRFPLVPDSRGAHRVMAQMSRDKPPRRSYFPCSLSISLWLSP